MTGLSEEIVEIHSSDDEEGGRKNALLRPKQIKYRESTKGESNTLANSTVINLEELSCENLSSPNHYNETLTIDDRIYDKRDFTTEFLEMINLCLHHEFSSGMTRILTRTLIPSYYRAEKKYVNSYRFQKLLKMILVRLKDTPSIKFSQILETCQHLKNNTPKRRVELITISSSVSEGIHVSDNNVKRKSIDTNVGKGMKRTRKSEIINIEDAPQISNEIIDLELEMERDSDDVIEVLSYQTGSECTNVVDVNDLQKNKTNTTQNSNIDTEVSQSILNPNTKCLLTPQKEKNMNTVNVDAEVSQSKLNSDPKCLLTPQKDTNMENIKMEIKRIEAIIKDLKNKMKEYDNMEVTEEHENSMSPYILSHVCKTKIVAFYQQLCALKGKIYTSKKSHSVTLTVADGHPEGPVRKFQELLNDHKNDEEVWFPDFIDVVKCVSKANEEDSLGWSKSEILSEARLLFTRCGRALQKCRQKREWRDMMSQVEDDVDLDVDPADQDPELMLKLNENKLLAKSKEDCILEMYSNLQNIPKHNIGNQQSGLPGTSAPSNKISVATESALQSQNMISFESEFENAISQLNSKLSTEAKKYYKLEEPAELQIDNNKDGTEIETEVIISDSEDYSTSEDDESDFELDSICLPIKEEITENPNKENDPANLSVLNEVCLSSIKIKNEIKVETSNVSAEETMKMMIACDDKLDEATITVFNIEEPVVFIEISSSDSDDE